MLEKQTSASPRYFHPTLFNSPLLPWELRFLHWTEKRPETGCPFLLLERPRRLAPWVMSEAETSSDLLWMSDIFLCKYFRQSRNSKPLLGLPNVSHDKSLFSDVQICVRKPNKGKMFRLCLNPKAISLERKKNPASYIIVLRWWKILFSLYIFKHRFYVTDSTMIIILNVRHRP